jgi:hypothetical protein
MNGLDAGDRCICQYDDWYNCHGEADQPLRRGQRLRITRAYRVGGAPFLEFEEAPGLGYLSTGFKPLRALN